MIPQEIYLLERYTSAEYFGQLRDTWQEIVAHLEKCLNEFMRNLPLDYHDRPLPEQPEAVWGERVIPNFRDTLQSLNDGYAKLLGGDIAGLEYCHGPLNDFKGQTDFWSGWMARSDENIYGELLNKAVQLASNIRSTAGAYWNPLTLSSRYDALSRGPLDAPKNWPMYQLDSAVSVKSDEPLSISGISLPEIDNSCAEFLSTEYETAPLARVYVGDKDLVEPDTGLKYGQQAVHIEKPCSWRLVKRVSGIGAASTPSLLDSAVLRVAAGTACPLAGIYFAPAKDNSRKRFIKGEVMPAFDSAYGETIWQWDINQE